MLPMSASLRESKPSPTSKISLATKISARVRLKQETKRASSRVTPSDGDEATFQVEYRQLRVVVGHDPREPRPTDRTFHS